ncbi:MAG: hypothetical protein PHW77_06305 [Eubacteriales bacterium]|nr:hypothetical protein [Eubacteriales bacterium]
MEPIVINKRKNEKWQSMEAVRAYYNSMRLVKIYKTAFTLADIVLAVIIIYKIAAHSNSYLTLCLALFAASAMFTVWLNVKPVIDGNRMYLESLLANGEDHVSETHIYEDRIEYYSEDAEKCSSISLDKVYNVFETKNLYEIQLIDDDGNMIGHMLLKSGFVKGNLDDVKRYISPGQRSLPKK